LLTLLNKHIKALLSTPKSIEYEDFFAYALKVFI
jgi:hypothetical protein